MKLIEDKSEIGEIEFVSIKEITLIGHGTDTGQDGRGNFYSPPEIIFRCKQEPTSNPFFYRIKDNVGRIHDILIKEIKRHEDCFVVRAERTCGCHFWQ